MKNIKPFKISFITAFIVTLIFSLVVIITPGAKPLVGVELSDQKVAIKDEDKEIKDDEAIDDELEDEEELDEKEDKEDKETEEKPVEKEPVEEKPVEEEPKEEDDLVTSQESEASITYPSTPESTAVYFGRTFAEVDMTAVVLFDTETYTGPAKPSDSNDFKVKSEIKEGTEVKVVGISTNEFLRIEMSDGSIAFLDAKAAKEK